MDATKAALPSSPRAVKRLLRRRAREQTGFDAFISHAHDPDARLAARLESSLERWARPWYGGRSMRVFRDVSKMRAGPSLRAELTEAMAQSDWLVVVLSPAAAESTWVEAEIVHWLATRDPEHILLVHADGSLSWDPAINDFAADSTALPPALRGAFTDEPRFVDLTDGGATRRARRKRYDRGVRDLATTIHDLPADLLDGAHRSTVRATRLWAGGVTTFLVASLVLGTLWLGSSRQAATESARAERESERATEKEAVAAANALAARALDMYESDVDTGLLAAVEAWAHRQTPETHSALLAGVVRYRHLEQVVRLEDTPHRIAVSPDETLLAVFTLEQRLLVWDLDLHRVIAETSIDTFAERMAFSPDSALLALLTPDIDPTSPNTIEIRPVAQLSSVQLSVQLERSPSSLTFAGNHRLIVLDTSGVHEVDLDGGVISTLVGAEVRSFAVDEAGATLALSTGNLVQVWDIGGGGATGIEEAELDEPIGAVGLSAGGDVVGFATPRSLGVWHRPSRSLTTSLQVIGDVVGVVPTEDRFGTTACRDDGSVVMWEPFAADTVEIEAQTKAASAEPAMGSRGLRTAAIGDRLVWVWRTDVPYPVARPLMTGNVLRFEGEPLVRHVDFSPTDGSLIVTEADRLSLWDPVSGAMVSETSNVPCIAVFAEDGATLLTVEPSSTAGAGSLGHRRADDLGVVAADAAVASQECHLALDRDRTGAHYAANADVLEAATGAVLASGTTATAMDSALSLDGSVLVWTSSGTDQTGPLISVLDVPSGETERYPAGQALWGVAVAPDGEIATGITLGATEGAIALWSMQDGEAPIRTGELPRYHAGTSEPAGEDPAVALAFSADGRQLAAGSYLGSVVVWDVSPDAWVAAACGLAGRGLSGAELEGTFAPANLGFEVANVCASRALEPTALPSPPPTTTSVAPEADDASVATDDAAPDTGDVADVALAEVSLDGAPVLVAVADTEVLRTEVGLRGVTDLGDLAGMLFVYPDDVSNGFWMEGALIPLDAAFFDSSGSLVDSFTMELCATARCPVYFPQAGYRYALLAPAGSLQHLGQESRLTGAPSTAS